MRAISVGALFSLALTTGCTSLSDSEARQGIGHDGDGEGCKIEGSQIGKVGVRLEHGGVVVTLTSWTPKAGEPNEFMGFTYTLSGASSVVYTVKAGTQKYISDQTSWSHPNPTGNAISNVDFCDCPDGGDGGGGGGGDDNGSGDEGEGSGSGSGSGPIFL